MDITLLVLLNGLSKFPRSKSWFRSRTPKVGPGACLGVNGELSVHRGLAPYSIYISVLCGTRWQPVNLWPLQQVLRWFLCASRLRGQDIPDCIPVCGFCHRSESFTCLTYFL
jgi:hypothetical protein